LILSRDDTGVVDSTVSMMPLRLLGVFVVAFALAGCGSTAARVAGGTGTVTVPAYGVFPATTVVGADDAAACRLDAGSFSAQARMFLAHSGSQAAYPADLWYVILREALADFGARRCDPALLGRALRRRLGPVQRDALANDLPSAMAARVRESLAAAQ
jgi:hypothetical protein